MVNHNPYSGTTLYNSVQSKRHDRQNIGTYRVLRPGCVDLTAGHVFDIILIFLHNDPVHAVSPIGPSWTTSILRDHHFV